jgi:16S rRNA processing protein RimM
MQVTVGRIGRPHGIRGDVVVGVRTDEPELRFAKGSRLDTDPAARGPLVVVVSRWHSGELLVRFEGITDRDAAAELRGTWLIVDSSTLGALDDPDEFRDIDLIGLTVRTTDGTVVGTVDDVLHSGQDVLVVRRSSGPASPSGSGPSGSGPSGSGPPGSGEILVPFVKDIVPEVDVASGLVVIDPPPGLLDLGDTL